MAKKKILASIMAGIMAMTMAVPTFAAQIDPADCDHEFGYWRYTVKPTCTTEGKGDMYCPDCGSIVEKDATIKPLGHEFSNATTRNGNFYLYWTRRPSRSYAKAGMNRPAGVKTAHSCGHTSS